MDRRPSGPTTPRLPRGSLPPRDRPGPQEPELRGDLEERVKEEIWAHDSRRQIEGAASERLEAHAVETASAVAGLLRAAQCFGSSGDLSWQVRDVIHSDAILEHVGEEFRGALRRAV